MHLICYLGYSNPVDKLIATKDLSSLQSSLPKVRSARSDNHKEESESSSDDDVAFFSSDEEDDFPLPKHHKISNDLPIPNDAPAICKDGETLILEAKITLADLRSSYGKCYLVSRDPPHTNYYRKGFVLKNGRLYDLVIVKDPCAFPFQFTFIFCLIY